MAVRGKGESIDWNQPSDYSVDMYVASILEGLQLLHFGYRQQSMISYTLIVTDQYLEAGGVVMFIQSPFSYQLVGKGSQFPGSKSQWELTTAIHDAIDDSNERFIFSMREQIKLFTFLSQSGCQPVIYRRQEASCLKGCCR